MFTISITEKGGKKQRIECTPPTVTIGRLQGNDIVLPLGNVSKKHAEITFSNDTFTVADIGSTNGTYLNGRKITGPTLVRPGDKIYVGEFMVSIDSPFTPGGFAPNVDVSAPSRPSIPPPKPKQRKSIPPASPEKKISDTEDTLTSIDESILPEIVSSFKVSPKKQRSAPPPASPRTSVVPFSAPVEQLIDFVTIEERQIDRSTLPSVTDATVAAHIRKILNDMIEQLDREEQIPIPYTKGTLFMETFLSVVDLGPLSSMISDTSVTEIRINGRDNLQVVTQNRPQKMNQAFKSENQLVSAIRCLTAGLRRGFSPTTGGKFRLENGDLVIFQPTGIAKNPTALIRKAPRKTTLAEKPLQLIRHSLNESGSIMIGGNCLLNKLTVVEKILSELSSIRVVSVEPNPLLIPRNDEHLHFCMPSNSDAGTSYEQLLFDSVQFRPLRVCARATCWTDVPAIIRFGALGTPLIAEIPLGDGGDIANSIRAGLNSTGGDANQGLISLASAFDLLVICSADESAPLTDKIYRFKNDASNKPQLVPLYRRKN